HSPEKCVSLRPCARPRLIFGAENAFAIVPHAVRWRSSSSDADNSQPPADPSYCADTLARMCAARSPSMRKTTLLVGRELSRDVYASIAASCGKSEATRLIFSTEPLPPAKHGIALMSRPPFTDTWMNQSVISLEFMPSQPNSNRATQ